MAENKLTVPTESPVEEVKSQVRTIMYIQLLTAVIITGVICNILIIIVLMKKKFQTNIYLYLRAISVADLCALLFDITYAANLYAIHPKYTFQEAMYGAHFEFFLKQSCNATSTLLIIATAIERYISLCHPHKATNLCTKRRTKITIFCLVFASIFLNIPRIWERQIVTAINPETNITQYHDKILSDYANGAYYTFHKYFYVTLFMFLPIIMLIVLNARIVIGLKNYSKKKESMTTRQVRNKQEQKRSTVMLVITVIVFLVLVVPSAVAYLIQNDQSFGAFIFIACADILGEVNFAINFFIYVSCNKTFRETFLAMLQYRTCSENGNAQVIRCSSTIPATSHRTSNNKGQTHKIHPVSILDHM